MTTWGYPQFYFTHPQTRVPSPTAPMSFMCTSYSVPIREDNYHDINHTKEIFGIHYKSLSEDYPKFLDMGG